MQNYQTVRKELELYNPALLDKTEYLFLSKSDSITSKRLDEIKKEFKKLEKEIKPISIIDNESLKDVKEILNILIKEKTADGNSGQAGDSHVSDQNPKPARAADITEISGQSY